MNDIERMEQILRREINVLRIDLNDAQRQLTESRRSIEAVEAARVALKPRPLKDYQSCTGCSPTVERS